MFSKNKLIIQVIIFTFIILFSKYALSQDTTKTSKSCKSKIYESLNKKSKIDSGLFILFSHEDKLYFEINDSILGRDMLIGSRVSELSNTNKVVAGEMRRNPLLIRFSRDKSKLYMHQIVSKYMASENDAINTSIKRNSIPPILRTFPIVTFNTDSTSSIIDVTNFFTNEIPGISPFNNKYKAGKLEKDATFIIKSNSFPENIEIKTQMSYSNTQKEPFLIVINRSILLLPKKPMKPRIEDERVGYFSNSMLKFSSSKIGVDTKKYISRFRIEPKNNEIDLYKKGVLVEPKKKIVFYIDNAFPESWFPYIKAGIEDWQQAFEDIGFKNAIVALKYPLNDPNFNPEDIRFSCVRYISTPKSNSKGPRWIDPRSGEVIGGDVLWWHNVTELLRDWRFVQCAAADTLARKRNPDIKYLGEMIRYVTAHEVGHTLGLKHNMRASYVFPVDSLRSATFTQKYGTTPSIMDYARFNYIAQPEDKGVKFTPPPLGDFDIFTIRWGYQPIYDTENEDEENKILDEWIINQKGNFKYTYGDQQIGINFDPSSQNEALGNDAIKASSYGIKNVQYIMQHLVDWTTFKGENYSYLHHMYDKLLNQYQLYVNHVIPYLGGVYINKPVDGQKLKKYDPISKEKQKEALKWIFYQVRYNHQWILNQEIEDKLGSQKINLLKSNSKILDNLMSPVIFQRLYLYNKKYKPNDYLSNLHDFIWESTRNKKNLNEFERNIQASYINNLIYLLKQKNNVIGKSNSSKIRPIDYIIKSIALIKIEDARHVLKESLKNRRIDKDTKAHYEYFLQLLKDIC